MRCSRFPPVPDPGFRLKGAMGLMLAAGLLSGCYTQLYTGSYLERSQAYAGASPGNPASADTLAPPDSLLRISPSIVNHYYGYESSYRGHSYQDWDHPLLSFGFYSTRYRDYCGPYWWDRSWHHGRNSRARHGHHDRIDTPITGGKTGPYQSDKRIFSTPSSIPRPDKGQRSDNPPKSSGTETTPATRSSENGNKAADKPSRDKQESYPALRKGRR